MQMVGNKKRCWCARSGHTSACWKSYGKDISGLEGRENHMINMDNMFDLKKNGGGRESTSYQNRLSK
jgi:hypothetical protein